MAMQQPIPSNSSAFFNLLMRRRQNVSDEIGER
jgi:hypothetical protein